MSPAHFLCASSHHFNGQIKNVFRVCRASYFHIRALTHIRSSITENMANSVACALIQSRLDYANALYAAMSSTNFEKVQRVQNTLARVATLTAKRDRITPTLERLHWLPIRYLLCQGLSLRVHRVHSVLRSLNYGTRCRDTETLTTFLSV